MEKALDRMGFDSPRPIQAKTIPGALEGRDVLGLAPTGTGKTAAFALPILYQLKAARDRAPRCLVVAPTRELATQIAAEFDELGQFTGLRVATIFGGVGERPQIQALRRGVDVLVACPGRLLDLYERGEVELRRVEILVLDEADHMFDMGFLPAIRRIVKALPEDRQNLLFSATMPKEIRELADRVLYRPHVVELAHSSPAQTIQHGALMLEEGEKLSVLLSILESRDFDSGIVFSRTKFRARKIARKLEAAGLPAAALQGNMSQGQRERAMTGFRDGTFTILVATDIAARGIDVAGLSHVINYDVPNTPDAYTHRIGRTGRAEQKGRAITFVTPNDRDGLRSIERKLGKPLERYTLDGLKVRKSAAARTEKPDFERPRRSGGPARKRKRSGAHASGSKPSKPSKSAKTKNAKRKDRIRKAKESRKADAPKGAKGSKPKSDLPFGTLLD